MDTKTAKALGHEFTHTALTELNPDDDPTAFKRFILGHQATPQIRNAPPPIKQAFKEGIIEAMLEIALVEHENIQE
ncbi:hypothetical protein FEK30_00605 (plasmid) [Picosynechococcus sp. PCC 11901]|uniref:hypothetical protein n=1 Tax=Picosynechococcus sp. PCC 11901 TaxID=2579791 RepID=UPI0010FC177B|nr:hypothetical protein [Picosynechococcus sp. PCC 11901]QCS48060.1 hypothetical protein FEK30_00605 [Picosynechococcus sp. PCC 11901]